MMLPMMMPATGMREAGLNGAQPVAKMMRRTGITPASMATAAQIQALPTPERFAVVRTAMANISRVNRQAAHRWARA